MLDKYLNLLINNGIIPQSEVDIYKYKLNCLLEKMFTISVMILISLFFKQTIGIVIFIVSFFSLRNRTGGFHLSSFKMCFFGTMAIEMAVILCIKLQVIPLTISGILSAIATIIILILGAANHPDMDYEKEEFKFNKKYARLIVIIEFLIVVFFNKIKVSGMYIQSIEFSIILASVLLITAFVTGQHKKIM